MGTLYVVGTPIGNLEDLTSRAARILAQVDLIAAEDTRVTRRLLNHLGVRVPLVSYNEHNRRERLPALLDALKSGDLALVTDAGMPGVSDPGADLVSEAVSAGFSVAAVPGVSAVTAAMGISGLPGEAFLFLGFLPRRTKDRRAALEAARPLPHTLIIFEAPHRLLATMGDLLDLLGDRQVAVCRELTKLHEELFRGTLSQALERFSAPRGEFVLVVRGALTQSRAVPASASLAEATARLERLRAEGMGGREAVGQVADALGLGRNTVYRLWIRLGRRATPGTETRGTP